MRLSGITLISIMFLSSACTGIPKVEPEPCTLFNANTAVCSPSNGEPSYDRKTDDMLGYLCLSPDDQSDIKTLIKVLLEELDTLQKAR